MAHAASPGGDDSNDDRNTILIAGFSWVSSVPFDKFGEVTSKLRHDHFLPRPQKFIIHQAMSFDAILLTMSLRRKQ
jgi:hypothetical protein